VTRADPVPALVITGVSSEVGTAALTLAVLAEFRAGGPAVEAFRVGPDFIDPGFNELAIGRLSHTVDGRLGG
jgi:cobyrinic acid a,c-diamide synthase